MDLSSILHAARPPKPWTEGDTIPWNDPEFSKRMLKEHLTQNHDHASRRTEHIEDHVEWIHNVVLGGKQSRILDLGCGPGLYSNRLAALGHTVTGIDFSPASVEYARSTVVDGASFIEGDMRTTEYGEGYDLVMLIFGEFNVFSPENAALILGKAYHALKPGGKLLLEPAHFSEVRRMGDEPRSWFASKGGLFWGEPHLFLEESFWDEAAQAATTRFFIMDVATGNIIRYAASQQAYTNEQYVEALDRAGFSVAQFFTGLGSKPVYVEKFMAILAEKSQ